MPVRETVGAQIDTYARQSMALTLVNCQRECYSEGELDAVESNPLRPTLALKELRGMRTTEPEASRSGTAFDPRLESLSVENLHVPFALREQITYALPVCFMRRFVSFG